MEAKHTIPSIGWKVVLDVRISDSWREIGVEYNG